MYNVSHALAPSYVESSDSNVRCCSSPSFMLCGDFYLVALLYVIATCTSLTTVILRSSIIPHYCPAYELWSFHFCNGFLHHCKLHPVLP